MKIKKTSDFSRRKKKLKKLINRLNIFVGIIEGESELFINKYGNKCIK